MPNITPEVINKGPWLFADANGRTDIDPSTVNGGCVTIRYVDTSAATLSVVSTNVSGGERITPADGKENGVFDVKVPVDWVVADTAFYVRVVEAPSAVEKAQTSGGGGKVRPIEGAKVKIGSAESTTDSAGYAKFENLTPGTYPIKVDAVNYMYNTAGMGTEKDTDSDIYNDTIIVPDVLYKKYQLLETKFSVKIIGKRKVRV